MLYCSKRGEKDHDIRVQAMHGLDIVEEYEEESRLPKEKGVRCGTMHWGPGIHKTMMKDDLLENTKRERC